MSSTVAIQMPSFAFCMGMARFCQSVKSPASETVVAAGAVKRKVCFLGVSASSLAITDYPFVNSECLCRSGVSRAGFIRREAWPDSLPNVDEFAYQKRRVNEKERLQGTFPFNVNSVSSA